LIKYETKIFAQCLNDLVKTLLECTTLQKLSEETIRVIREHLFYDVIVLYLFNQEEKLQLRANHGINITEEIEHPELLDTSFILENLSERKMFIFQDWPNKKEYNQFFPGTTEFQSLAIIPLFYKNYILGFLCIGYRKKQKFTHEEMILFENIGIFFGERIGNLVHQTNYQRRVDELNEVIKRVRHDFANDIQSIALALELIQSTELDEDQEKYVRILNNSKDSTINRIKELKKLKKKHEDEVTIGFGLYKKE